MTNTSSNPTLAPAPKPTAKRPPRAMAGLAISKAVNPPKLLAELKAIGVQGTVQKLGATSFVLAVKNPPATVTTAQIQAVITAHNPTPVADPAIAQIDDWAQLTATQKDALMLTALKKLYQIQ